MAAQLGLGVAILAVLVLLLPLLVGGDAWPAGFRYTLAGLGLVLWIAAAGLAALALRALPLAAAAAGMAAVLLMGVTVIVSPLTRTAAPAEADRTDTPPHDTAKSKSVLRATAGSAAPGQAAAAAHVPSGLPVGLPPTSAASPPPPPDGTSAGEGQQLLTIQEANREGAWQRRIYSISYAHDPNSPLGDGELFWVVDDIESRSEVAVTGRLQDQGRLTAAVPARSVLPPAADDNGFETWLERAVDGRREKISNVIRVDAGASNSATVASTSPAGGPPVLGSSLTGPSNSPAASAEALSPQPAAAGGQPASGNPGQPAGGTAVPGPAMGGPPPLGGPPGMGSLPRFGGTPHFGGAPGAGGVPGMGGAPVAGAVVAGNGAPPERVVPPEPEGPARRRSTRYVSLRAGEKLEMALDDLKSQDSWKVNEALEQLAVLDPDPKHRDEVADMVGELCADTDAYRRKRALTAMARWYTPETFPKMVRCADDPVFWVRWAALDALSHVKEKKEGKLAAKAIVAQLKDEKMSAMRALKNMGPIAEDAVLADFGNSGCWGVDDALDVLEAIGTNKSLEKLAPYVHSRNFFIRVHVQRTVKAIEMRRMMK